MPSANAQPAPVAFIDRDGTVIYDMSYLADPAKIAFTPHAAEGLRLLQDNGYLLIMVTNQSGIGRGLITVEQFHSVQERMFALLESEGVHFTACYHCPHKPDDNCHCRKPNTGMLEQACHDFAVDRQKSLFIGDSEADMRLADNFQLRNIFLTTSKPVAPIPVAYTATDLLDAASWQLRHA